MDNKYKGKIEEIIYHGDHARVRLNLLGNKEFFLAPKLKIIKIANELTTINTLAFVNDISKTPIFISGPIL